MYQDWMLIVYNFSSVLSVQIPRKSKVLQCKLFKCFTLIKLILMVAINGALLVQPPLASIVFKEILNGGALSTFATNTIYISSKVYHGSAIILLIMQLVKIKKILEFLELIIICSQSDEVFMTKFQTYSS